MREPKFLRKEVAEILGVASLTIYNREKKGLYPPPRRDLNNYRIYDLNDVFNLQLLTYGAIDNRPIMSILYDKGWTDLKENTKLLDAALARRTGAS
jgi:hypothetical protein